MTNGADAYVNDLRFLISVIQELGQGTYFLMMYTEGTNFTSKAIY